MLISRLCAFAVGVTFLTLIEFIEPSRITRNPIQNVQAFAQTGRVGVEKRPLLTGVTFDDAVLASSSRWFDLYASGGVAVKNKNIPQNFPHTE
jgi:hypothetical protein